MPHDIIDNRDEKLVDHIRRILPGSQSAKFGVGYFFLSGLEAAREAIKALCEPVAQPKDTGAYLRHFCADDTTDKDALKDNEPKRIALYKLATSLVRAYANVANEMPEAGYSAEEIVAIKREVEHYGTVRAEVKLASGDYIDLKTYEPAMRHLIDTYIRAEDSKVVSAFDDMTLFQLVVERGVGAVEALPDGIRSNPEAVAETIENNVRRVIIDEQPINPKYYERMSALLDALVQERKAQALEYEEYLARVVQLTKLVKNPAGGTAYPPTLDTGAKRALCDNLGNDEGLALALDGAIRRTKKDGWRGNTIKEREVKHVIHEHLGDDAEVERVFDLVKNQREY